MGKHSKAPLTNYFSTHISCLEKLKERGIVTGDNLVTIPIGYGRVKIEGRLRIRDRLILTVNKTLQQTQRNRITYIKTTCYAYNLSSIDGWNILRYDNAHPHPGHKTDFHVHRFDLNTKEEVSGSPFEVINLEEWPTLGEVILEADSLYWQILEKGIK